MIAAPFAHHTKGSEWKTVAQRRTKTRLCALYKAYSRERGLESYTREDAMVSLLV